MKPTYEDLEAKVQRLEELLKQALEKISQLEEQLKRNSKNSSKPPSTDQKSNTPDTDKKPPRDSRTGKARPSFPPDKIDRHVPLSLLIKSIGTYNARRKTALIAVHRKYS